MKTAALLTTTLLLCSAVCAEDEPDPRTLLTLAVEAYEEGRYEACAELYARAIEAGAESEVASYNAACCYALDGDVDRAFELLDQSLEWNWRDVGLLETDTDLESLRADERWPAVVERAREAREAYLNAHNRELVEMYEADQGDRSGAIDWSVVAPRDEQRRKRVKEIIAAGEVETAHDYFHAAMVLQHGTEPEDYKMAHELALKASELDPEHTTARWLAAAAMDRYLQNIGKPQIYGTQFRKVDGKWTLEPIDETAVTDEERAEWGVPPLAAAKERAKAMNARE